MGKIKLSRREREKQRQRQDILDGALALFSKNDYHNVSIQEIARESEFAIGTLYKFFKSKEDLYESLLIELSNKCLSSITEAMDNAEKPIDKLRAYVMATNQILQENQHMIQLYHNETRKPGTTIPADVDSKMQTHHDIILKKLEDIFKKGIDDDLFIKTAEPFSLAISLESIVMAHTFLCFKDPEKYPYPEDPDSILSIILNGMLYPEKTIKN